MEKLSLSNFFITIGISIVISVLIIMLSYWGYNYKKDIEKTSVYECGFSPFGQARTPFNIKFYLVSLLFIVFDIETLILCPFTIEHLYMERIDLLIVYILLFFIILGIVYEILSNVLDF